LKLGYIRFLVAPADTQNSRLSHATKIISLLVCVCVALRKTSRIAIAAGIPALDIDATMLTYFDEWQPGL
jgi:hypothetical protein